MRLVRGLWFVDGRLPDGTPVLTQPTTYDLAAVEAPQLVEEWGVVRATLRRLPDTRARWEYLAPFEASDRPRWGEDP